MKYVWVTFDDGVCRRESTTFARMFRSLYLAVPVEAVVKALCENSIKARSELDLLSGEFPKVLDECVREGVEINMELAIC